MEYILNFYIYFFFLFGIPLIVLFQKKTVKKTKSIVWLFLGGGVFNLIYFIVTAMLLISIIGIPLGLQVNKIRKFAVFPYAMEVNDNSKELSRLDIFLNIIWWITGGPVVALTHLLFALLFTITIIGFPFAKKHKDIALLSLMPFGKEVVWIYEKNEIQ